MEESRQPPNPYRKGSYGTKPLNGIMFQKAWVHFCSIFQVAFDGPWCVVRGTQVHELDFIDFGCFLWTKLKPSSDLHGREICFALCVHHSRHLRLPVVSRWAWGSRFEAVCNEFDDGHWVTRGLEAANWPGADRFWPLHPCNPIKTKQPSFGSGCFEEQLCSYWAVPNCIIILKFHTSVWRLCPIFRHETRRPTGT